MDLYKKLTYGEAVQEYNTVMIEYEKEVQLKSYKDVVINYVPEGLEVDRKQERSCYKKEMKTNVRDDSLTRSRSLIIDLVKSNTSDWKSFITLTFKENIQDVESANKIFNVYLTQVRRRFKDFKYLAVIEFQKRGAIHYHMLTNIECDSELIERKEDKEVFSIKTKKRNIIKYYDLRFWNYGYSIAYDIINDTDEKFSPVLYMMKYLYKNINNISDKLYGKRRVLSSRNLKRPIKTKVLLNEEEFNYLVRFVQDKNELISVKDIETSNQFIPSIKVVNFNKKIC